MIEETPSPPEELPAIAIVGMAGRFPQAADIHELWSHLCAGRECLTRFSAAELRAAGVQQALLNDSRYVPVNGLLPDIELFDAGFFGMNPREASITDPQHRVFLELAWNALEHSGHDAANYPGTIGVYAGCGMSSYLLDNLWSNRAELADVGELRVRMANSQEYLATRVSYKLNLTGPSISINTACSTSLVAVHVACDALLNFQCDMALAGGISIQVPQVKGYVYEEGGILSPDGHCRAFDAGAQGTVSGNGGAVVVLKRLADAVSDGDTIYARIRGSAINNDGADKAGFTAPSVTGQARVIAEAQAMAGIHAETIGYVETHGTGTPLGDPIEFAALTQVFRSQTGRAQFCALGSVKTNVGHLDEAAGVTGLIKTALSLYHRRIPPSLHFTRPNPEIDAAASPFYVNTELSDWPAPANGARRRAAVSSFGIGGTNAHLLLEETPARANGPWARPVQLFPCSARSVTALGERTSDLATCIASHPEQDLADIAYTLQIGRRTFAWRRSVLVANGDEAVTALRQAQPRTPPVVDPPPIVFMFSGQGSQHPGMAGDLYEHESVFRHWLDTCAERLRPLLDRDLRDLLYPRSADGERRAAAELQQTDLAQPALFALEYSLAQLWMHWGIRPQAMIGHSIGEYLCACLAGVLEFDVALDLVTARGRLMQSAPEGAMLSVPLDLDSVQRYLKNGIELAAQNAPDRCVVAGSTRSIFDLTERLRVEGIEAHPLKVSHAFHSASMTPIVEDFNTVVRRHSLRSPQLPYLSNLTGDWIGPDEAGDPAYYGRHLRQPVRFAAGLSRLLEAYPGAVFVEIGPGQALTQLARRCAPADTLCLASLPPAGTTIGCHRVLLASLGHLWERGAEVDWKAFAEPGRRRVGLPGYPFQRQRHWIEPRRENQSTAESSVKSSAQPIDRWCYVPRWQSKPAPLPTSPSGHWLLFTNNDTNDLLAEVLRQAGCRVTVVEGSDRWTALGPDRYSLRPQSREDYLALLEDIHEPPSQIVWLWSYGSAPGWLAEDWCFALLALVQALESQPSPPRLSVIVSGLAAVAPGEGIQLSVEKGTLSGLMRSASLEYPQLTVRLIDVTATALNDAANVSELITFCQDESNERFVALRAGRRWTSQYEALPPDSRRGFSLRRGGVYLITGGLGGIGLTLAEELARNWQARLVLLGRTALPPEADWEDRLADSSTPKALRLTLQRLRDLRDRGAELLIEVADIGERDQLARVINRARERFGVVNGVIHAAGVADGALLARQTKDGMAEVLAAKVAGTRLLWELLSDERLDFCLLCSALSGVTGAPGQSAYCAANSFLDHFAQAAPTPWPVIAIDWDAWREVGMAVNSGSNSDTTELAQGLSCADGIAAFHHALAAGQPQLVVSTEKPLEIIERLRGLKLSDDDFVASGANDRPQLNSLYAAPQGEIEARLTSILEKLLGINGIGRDDDYFALGGDSLMGTRYIAQINRDLSSRLTLRDLFEVPTIAALATLAGKPSSSPASRISPAPPRPDYPLTHAQKRLWILAQNPAASVAYNMSYSLSLNGELDVAALRRAFGLVVERHEVLRTAFITVNGEPRQQPRPAMPFQLPFRDLRNESDIALIVDEEVRNEALVPFDLEQPPLLRARLLKVSDHQDVLLVSMHHIISDGLSLNVLLPELHEFYAALCANRAANLPPLSIQYKDFAVWQKLQLNSEAMRAHRVYWLEKLSGELPVLALPTDRPRPPFQEFSGGHVLRRLPVPARDALHHFCQQQGVTLFMLLVATVKVLLHQITGQDDILIGSPVAGHEHAELEGQIGYYLNNVVLRDTVRRSEPFTTLLQRVRNTVVEALAHQDYPFDLLIEELGVTPAPGHSPLFDVQLNLIPGEPPSLKLGDLVVADTGMVNQTAIFDLNFMFSDRPPGLAVEIDYSTALFEAARIEQLGDHLLLLLTAIAEQPQISVRSLCGLLEVRSSSAEKAEFLAAALNLDEEF